jgi:hypothetical protein
MSPTMTPALLGGAPSTTDTSDVVCDAKAVLIQDVLTDVAVQDELVGDPAEFGRNLDRNLIRLKDSVARLAETESAISGVMGTYHRVALGIIANIKG